MTLFWWSQAIPVQVRGPQTDTTHQRPGLPPIGEQAKAVLQDSLGSLPARAEHWVVATLGGAVRLLPRLILALLAALAVIAIASWVHRILLRRTGQQPDPAHRARVSLAGGLAAVTVAAAIVGASTLAAGLLVFLLFLISATVAQLVGQSLLRRSRIGPGASELLLAVVRTVLLTLGMVEALTTIGLNIGGVFAGLGIIGLAVGFAAQDTLANLIAGFTILWDRPLSVGDWVQVGDGPAGRVQHLTLRTTRIETIELGMLIVPNKDVTGSRLYNYSMLNHGRIRLNVGVPADADLGKARQLLIGVATADDRVSRSPGPVVNVIAIGDAAITLELVVEIADPSEARLLRSALTEGVLTSFHAQGLKAMEPHPPADPVRGPWGH